MELWLAVLLFAAFAGGFVALSLMAARKKKRAWLIAGVCALGVAMLALTGYIALTLLFLDAVSSRAMAQLVGSA